MKILVLGGDGFIGWPLSLDLSKDGHDVFIIDNFKRREIDQELEVNSLTPIKSLKERLIKWTELTNFNIVSENVNVDKDYQKLQLILKEFKPEVIFHLAEFKSAPYSMRSASHKIETVGHNVNAANIILSGIIESEIDTHLIHIGTMGVYGYSSSDNSYIPEGYVDVDIKYDNGHKEHRNILYPFNPGSIYHLSKSLDNLIFQFYAKNDHLKITDLHQGIVWGCQTPNTSLHDDLINRFDYDGDYGTVLNRFIIQASLNYPLTMHGSGGQTRALINLNDTIKCLKIAMNNEHKNDSKVRIFNQLSETKRIKDIAEIICSVSKTEVANIVNPRNEAAENELNAKNNSLINLGFKPILFDEEHAIKLLKLSNKYKDNCDVNKIPSLPSWKNNNKLI